MKIAAINGLQSGSPSTMMRGIASTAIKKYGFNYLTFYGNWKNSAPKYQESERFGFLFENVLSGFLSRLLGVHCRGSVFGTLSLINKLKKYDPDIIHLHNLHFWSINIPLLFKYIKKEKIKVVWTLHDCWPFTGRCPYFQCSKCDKWKTGCFNCSYPKNAYPSSMIDNSKHMWKLKKKWFSDIDHMYIVTPSKWLAELVRESYLSQYPIMTISNGIDLKVFYPKKTNFRNNYNLENKIVVLGVSFSWNYYKGLDVFIELSKKLDENYKVVLVGVNEQVKKQLPSNILALDRTTNANELADIYSSADVFVNPTREENYPTVNMEAICCGLPVVTFNTGGCAEIVNDNCGFVTAEKTCDAIISEINKLMKIKDDFKEKCVEESSRHDMYSKFIEYCELYKTIISE